MAGSGWWPGLPGSVRPPHAELDPGSCPDGVKVSDAQMNALPLARHDWHGDWNYTLRPEGYDPAAGAPDPFDQPSPGLAWLCHPAPTGLPAHDWHTLIAIAHGLLGILPGPAMEALARRAAAWGPSLAGMPEPVPMAGRRERRDGAEPAGQSGDVVEIFTDGACSPNPGPGGWGAILRYGRAEREIYGGDPATTNNRMEIMAAIQGLESLTRPATVHVYTDSVYLRKGITEWLPRWKLNGWQTRDRKPVKNADLWLRLEAATQNHELHWFWVKGHAGHPENERADALACRGADEAAAQLARR